MIDYLRVLANKRLGAFWPPAAPFTDCDVVLSFRSKEDAAAFSEALAFGPVRSVDVETDFVRAWNADQIRRVSDGKRPSEIKQELP